MSVNIYRIWDKEARRFILENEGSLHCSSNWAICPFTGELFDYISDVADGKSFSRSSDPGYWMDRTASSIKKGNRYVLQQFIGLKDKNEKPIYEGDVLRCRGYSGWFDEAGFLYNHTVTREVRTSGESELSGFLYIQSDREVVGNIFETPELVWKT